MLFILENWIVYKHTNKTNGKIYIGITSKNPNKRWRIDGSGYKTNNHFWNAIQKYGWEDGFTHEILLSGLSREEALSKEVELIAFYKSLEPNGYNQTQGGEGANGWKMNDEQKAKISKANKGRKRPPHIAEMVRQRSLGKIPSEETRKRMSTAQTGRKHTEETKRMLSEMMKQKGIPQAAVDAVALVHKKPVDQYTLDGRFIKRWNSAMDAERSGEGFAHNAIAKCAKGKTKHHMNFIWKYVESEVA